MGKKDDFERFNKKVLRLSGDRTMKEAYELAERLEMRERGERKFKNYGSYASSQTYHRKNLK